MSEPRLQLGPDDTGQVLVIESGKILAAGTELPSDEGAMETLDCSGARIGPGDVNAHTHLYSGLAPFDIPPPHPKPKNFVQILERLWWLLDRALDERALTAAARYYVAESLLAGTTTLIDHHESPQLIEGSLDILADACRTLGSRAVLCYGATERNGGRSEAVRGLAECRRFIESNQRPTIRGLVGLHASFTVSDATLVEAGDLCRELDSRIHVHMAEDLADVVDARKRGWEGPLERLLELRGLPRGSILAHGVHLERREVLTTASKGLWLVQNPRSNRGNEVGYPRALPLSDRVAVGTDGYPSRMRDEAEVLRQESIAHGDDPAAVDRRLRAGHRLAAELFDISFDPVVPGTAADLVVSDGESVRHVVVDGRLVVRDGELLTADIEEIRAAARSEAPRLWAKMAELAAVPVPTGGD